jgi:hypothetical protein
MARDLDLTTQLNFMRREIERRQRERDAGFAAYRTIAIAKVNALNGSIEVPNKPGYVWVSTWGIAGGRYQAFNKGFSLTDGTPVMVAVSPQRPFSWEIIDLYTAGLLPGEGGLPSSYRVGIHAKNHQIPSEANPGKDPVTIYQPALDLLKSFIYSGLVIGVRPLIYQLDDEIVNFLGVQSVDLASYVPVDADVHRWVLVYLATATNGILVLAGDTVDDGSEAVKPAIPEGAIPSSYWLLATGQTTLSMVTNYFDARSFLGIVVTDAATTFDPDTIVVDAQGDVVTDGLGNVVVEAT